MRVTGSMTILLPCFTKSPLLAASSKLLVRSSFYGLASSVLRPKSGLRGDVRLAAFQQFGDDVINCVGGWRTARNEDIHVDELVYRPRIRQQRRHDLVWNTGIERDILAICAVIDRLGAE